LLPKSQQIGYSPKGTIASMALGGLLIVALVALGFRRYKGGILLAGNNSRAISAACHPPLDDTDAAYSGLMWGAVSHQGSDGTPGHCCFISKYVEPPIAGQRYAGSAQLDLKISSANLA
jgi:hypothetical protein